MYVEPDDATTVDERSLEIGLDNGNLERQDNATGRKDARDQEYVMVDLRVMKIRQWTEKAEDREQWRLVVKEAKAQPGL